MKTNWSELYSVLVRAVLAGVMIGFGCIIYLMCSNKLVGACLFSFGLLTIILRDLMLYTSKIGYLPSIGIGKILITIVGNWLGTFLVGNALRLTRLQPDIMKVVEPKLNDGLLSLFILSIACGTMMYLAADSYKRSRSWLFVILPVVVFIVSGFEHSIANMCYFSIAGVWEPRTFGLIGLMIVGNGVGSALMNVSVYGAKEGESQEKK